MRPYQWTHAAWTLWWCLLVQLLSHVRLFVTPWTLRDQATLSMEFPRQEHWEWVAISFSRGSGQPGIELMFPYIGRRILYHWATRKAHLEMSRWCLTFQETAELLAACEVASCSTSRLALDMVSFISAPPRPSGQEEVSHDSQFAFPWWLRSLNRCFTFIIVWFDPHSFPGTGGGGAGPNTQGGRNSRPETLMAAWDHPPVSDRTTFLPVAQFWFPELVRSLWPWAGAGLCCGARAHAFLEEIHLGWRAVGQGCPRLRSSQAPSVPGSRPQKWDSCQHLTQSLAACLLPLSTAVPREGRPHLGSPSPLHLLPICWGGMACGDSPESASPQDTSGPRLLRV